jgi:hypothetical protein
MNEIEFKQFMQAQIKEMHECLDLEGLSEDEKNNLRIDWIICNSREFSIKWFKEK